MQKELQTLFNQRTYDLPEWSIGYIPKHYKRLSVNRETALRLAKIGQVEIGTYFNERLFFSQSVIAGAILSDEFDDFTITTTSQYGKSWLLARVAVLRAYKGRPVYIAGVSGDATGIIMRYVIDAIQTASPEVQNALLNKKDQIERLATSVSKTKLSFSTGGFVEAVSLADTYKDNLSRNKAVGRGGDFYIDECALISDETMDELGRGEFARIDHQKYQTVKISNPHKAGAFYDALVGETGERDFVLWMDALTAVEEDRFTEEQVAHSRFARRKHTRRVYLLCELDEDGGGFLEQPKLYQAPVENQFLQYFLGIDSAYKGKDSIDVALNAVDEEGICHIEEVVTIDKGEWVDGVTSTLIINDIERIARKFRVTLVCVDIGWGVWLVEGLNQRGIKTIGINFGSRPTKERQKAGHYASRFAENMRAELHMDLQNLIEENHILFDEQVWEKVKDVFPLVSCTQKANGRYSINPKTEIKAKMGGKSPDELDAVLLSIHAPLIFGIY